MIEEQYVSPNDANIVFPETKRNLIYIFMESMETSFMQKGDGGLLPMNLIPEIQQLINENTYFACGDGYNGAKEAYATTWTSAGITAQMFGLPLKAALNKTNNDKVLPRATGLGDILSDNGYYCEVIMGSDINFGNKISLFAEHGFNNYVDYNKAKELGYIDDNYRVFWGYEDEKLYEIAKDRINDASEQNQPFAFVLETVDSHMPYGYFCNYCEKVYQDDYLNAISCASKQVYNFIEWAKQQNWYENTTIVIAGDHLTMRKMLTSEDEMVQRGILNIYINSATQTENTKNRLFNTMDLLPTTLSALGCTYNGDRIGLGTDLYSSSPTLYEQYGMSYIEDNLKLKSKYYLNTFY